MTEPAAAPAARSTFVSNLAWTFIVLSGLGVIISLFQTVVLNLLVPDGTIEQMLSEERGISSLPGYARFIFANIRLMPGLFLLANAVILAISIELLMRKNWARILFALMMFSTAALHFGGASGIYEYFPPASLLPPEMTTGDMAGFLSGVKLVATALTVIFGTLFLWIGIKLMTKGIRAEFISSPPSRS